jgi:serine/threonine protein kinase
VKVIITKWHKSKKKEFDKNVCQKVDVTSATKLLIHESNFLKANSLCCIHISLLLIHDTFKDNKGARLYQPFLISPPFQSDITLGDEIGKGAFGVVRLAEWKQPIGAPKQVAVKICELKKAGSNHRMPDPRLEAQILQELGRIAGATQVIIEFYGSYTDEGKEHLVMEYCKHGSIYDYLVKKGGRQPFSEERARAILLNILSALDYIHGAGFIHRDLSPKNILIHNIDDEGMPKIVSPSRV